MTTAQLKNNYENRLALPNGQTVEPGDTVTVENWDKMESNNVIQAWLAARVIEVTEPDTVDEPELDLVTTAASKKLAKTAAGAKTNAPAPSSPASGEPAPAIGEPIVNNEPAPADAPSWKDPK